MKPKFIKVTLWGSKRKTLIPIEKIMSITETNTGHPDYFEYTSVILNEEYSVLDTDYKTNKIGILESLDEILKLIEEA